MLFAHGVGPGLGTTFLSDTLDISHSSFLLVCKMVTTDLAQKGIEGIVMSHFVGCFKNEALCSLSYHKLDFAVHSTAKHLPNNHVSRVLM